MEYTLTRRNAVKKNILLVTSPDTEIFFNGIGKAEVITILPDGTQKPWIITDVQDLPYISKRIQKYEQQWLDGGRFQRIIYPGVYKPDAMFQLDKGEWGNAYVIKPQQLTL